MRIWDTFRSDHHLALVPWASIEIESSDALRKLGFVGGVSREIVSGLHEAHVLLHTALDVWIIDLVSRRALLDASSLQMRVEDAFAEVVQMQPDLLAHIRCGWQPDGSFEWKFPLDSTQSAAVRYAGLRVENAVTKGSASLGFERPMAPAVGRFLGFLDGTYTVSEIRAALAAAGPDVEEELTRLLRVLETHQCLTVAPRVSVRARWLAETRDRDVVHLGHAGLLYRQEEHFLLFDLWVMPWFAEAAVPSLWGSLLPLPAALFLTHEHSDHLDPRTLLHLPKDIPIIVPSRKNRRALHYDYLAALGELGFTQVIELAHGEVWPFEGGGVVAVPFFGEDPCDLELPRNCYLISDRGRNTLVLADSSPTNSGRSAVKEGVIDDLVRQYGPIATLFASQQQLLDVRGYVETACLSPPGRWLEMGEDGYLNTDYLAQLAASAKARLFVSYATGDAEWYSDDLSSLFNPRKPARTAFLTANWEPLEQLEERLRSLGRGYHYSQVLDLYRLAADGDTQVISAAEALGPTRLFSPDYSRRLWLRS